MKPIKLLIILFVLLSAGCSREVVKMAESAFIHNPDSVIISVQPEKDPVELSSLIDSVRYVILELTDESIVGNIDKLVIFEDRIYILDKLTSSVFIFDMDGKYLSKISKIGNGPGEYSRLHFFDIEPESRQIVLTDLTTYWNMRYDLDGNFISRKLMPLNTEGFAPVPCIPEPICFFCQFQGCYKGNGPGIQPGLSGFDDEHPERILPLPVDSFS